MRCLSNPGKDMCRQEMSELQVCINNKRKELMEKRELDRGAVVERVDLKCGDK